MKRHFDVIVVGAGLAGLTAAYVLARNGFDVMVAKKADHCGEKNVLGGVFHGDSFHNVFSKKAIEVGAKVLCGVTVDDIILDHGAVKGVSVNDEKVYSDVVILAEGVNAILTEWMGLRVRLEPYQVGMGVKEIISLDKAEIHERFNVDSGQGCSDHSQNTLKAA